MKGGFILLAACVLLFSTGWAEADVRGAWDVSGTTTVKVVIKGAGSDTQSVTFTDRFVFDSDGSFEMTDFEGSWAPSGKKVLVRLDNGEIEEYFTRTINQALEDEGIEAEIANLAVTQNSFVCKEAKTALSISGSMKLAMTADLYVAARGRWFSLKVNSKTAFTGSRAAASGLAEANRSGAALFEAIGRGLAATVVQEAPLD